ncbi:MAG: hypothetical protein ABR958_10250 [Dehalococcoidales bacterium]
MEQKYTAGQRVKFIIIAGSDPAIDRQINSMAGKTGTIVRSYCVTKDEMPDLIKMFVYSDVYSYDIQMDDGDIVRGIPEPALEVITQRK